jgi:hypothetical protein
MPPDQVIGPPPKFHGERDNLSGLWGISLFVILGCGWMLVIIMLEQRVVGVVGLDAAGSRIRMASSEAPGACLGHEPGDTRGQ